MDDEVIAEFESDYREKQPSESLAEYYVKIRDDELKDNTKRNVLKAWRQVRVFASEYLEKDSTEQVEFSDLDSDIISSFINHKRKEDLKDSTIHSYLSSLHTMINWLNTENLVSGSPIKTPFKSTDWDLDTLPKIRVTNPELRKSVSEIRHPYTLFQFVSLLKTGLRMGEFVNLDERDVTIDRPIADDLDGPRAELRGKENCIYVDSSISSGDVIDGEERSASNKPNSTRVVPLDDETVDLFSWFLALRNEPNIESNPINTTISGGSGSTVGDRYEATTIRDRIQSVAKVNEWRTGDSGSVTPHWCRHWYTTKIRSNVDPELVEVGNEDDFVDFLRGDTSSDTRDDYLQMTWGPDGWMHRAVEDALPNLLTEGTPYDDII